MGLTAVDWAGMWHPLRPPLETAIRAAIVYVFVHVAFRVVGRRELGGYSAYDIVFLFFISVVMRQSVVGNDPSLTTALIGFTTLLAIDVCATLLICKSTTAARIIEGPVRELVRDGVPNLDEMKKVHISMDQLLASARHHGRDRLADVHRAYLERSGHISFIFSDASRG